MKLRRSGASVGPAISKTFAAFVLCTLFAGCASRHASPGPSIEFSKIPPVGEGGPVPLVPIAGRVKGARPDEKIVLFAKAANGVWWVQPVAIQPLISIAPDSTWTVSTHLGTEYAALVVEPGYRPPATTAELPKVGGKIAAVAVVKGTGQLVSAEQKTIQFSGYEWKAMNAISERNGVPYAYDPANVSVDSGGHLHLRIVRQSGRWTCSEVIHPQSLGYGTYLFSVEDVSHLQPAAVLTLFTWDDLGAEQNHREMDVEISKWGDSAGKNAQFVVQPYYVPENVMRFNAPSGPLVYSIRWEPGKASFQAVRNDDGSQHRPEAAHVFTSGIPAPGSESASINFCAFGLSKTPLKDNAEVVIDKFQYLP